MPHFRVTTVEERPYVMLKRGYEGTDENGKFEGFCVELLERLSKDLGFTYTIHAVKDGRYGSEVNGTWDGMIGEIIRNVIHSLPLSLYPSLVTPTNEMISGS